MNSKLTKFAKVAAIGLALTFTLSCSSGSDDGNNNGGGTSSPSGGGDLSSSSIGGGDGSSSSATGGGDASSSSITGGGDTQGSCPNAVIGNNTISCGGQTYKTVLIGDQVWMAENLNYNVQNSECYDDDPANCVTYGKLYDWATAMGIDTKYNIEGWRGSYEKHQGICPADWHIPSDAEWKTLAEKLRGSGTDFNNFAAQWGGNRKGGVFEEIGSRGYYWTTMESGSDKAWRYIMYKNETNSADFNHSTGNKPNLYSVRCIKD